MPERLELRTKRPPSVYKKLIRPERPFYEGKGVLDFKKALEKHDGGVKPGWKMTPAQSKAIARKLHALYNSPLIESIDAHLENPNAETPHSAFLGRLDEKSLRNLRSHLDGSRL